jgi:hypothetical protein
LGHEVGNAVSGCNLVEGVDANDQNLLQRGACVYQLAALIVTVVTYGCTCLTQTAGSAVGLVGHAEARRAADAKSHLGSGDRAGSYGMAVKASPPFHFAMRYRNPSPVTVFGTYCYF